MSRNYEDEQETLKEEMKILREEIELQEQQMENLQLFIQKVKEHTEMETLTPYAASQDHHFKWWFENSPKRAAYIAA